MTTPVLRRVLLVEDEPDIQTIAILALETVGGLDVLGCSSGAEAVAAAPGFAPDLILLDMLMPEMDGIETLAALRSLPGLAAVPAVFLTAKVQRQEIARYRAAGALDVVTKPFDPMQLATTLRAIWTRAHA